MKNDSLSILFLGKEDDKFCEKAQCFVKNNFKNSDVFLGKWGDSFPDRINSWQGDYIISYLSRWIIPNSILSRARKAAINFHPGSPEYPGV